MTRPTREKPPAVRIDFVVICGASGGDATISMDLIRWPEPLSGFVLGAVAEQLERAARAVRCMQAQVRNGLIADGEVELKKAHSASRWTISPADAMAQTQPCAPRRPAATGT
jgi:hypothetical protein